MGLETAAHPPFAETAKDGAPDFNCGIPGPPAGLLGIGAFVVAAVHASGVQGSGVAGAVGAGAVVGLIGPVALNLPVRVVKEGHIRAAEGPGALVAVFAAVGGVPGIAVGIGAGFRKLVAADVGQRRQTLRFAAHCALRVAPGIAVKIEEEAELHRRAAARAPAMVGAVVGASALAVNVHGIVAVGDSAAADDLANFGEHGRGAEMLGQAGSVSDMAAVGHRGADLVAAAVGVLIHCGFVSRT